MIATERRVVGEKEHGTNITGRGGAFLDKCLLGQSGKCFLGQFSIVYTSTKNVKR